MKAIKLILPLLLTGYFSFAQTTPWTSSPSPTPQTRTNNGSPEIRWLWGSQLFSVNDSLKNKISYRDTLNKIATWNYVASHTPPTPTLQSVATAGNSFNGQIAAGNFYLMGSIGNTYLDLPPQNPSPIPTANRLKVYSDSLNRFSWKNSMHRRTLRVTRPSDMTITMPYALNPTLADSTQVATSLLTKEPVQTGTGYVKSASGVKSYVTAIPNTDLANSTISGVSLGGTLTSLIPGYGVTGLAYNGSSTKIWSADTTSTTGLVSKARLTTALGSYQPLENQRLSTTNDVAFNSVTINSVTPTLNLVTSGNSNNTWVTRSQTNNTTSINTKILQSAGAGGDLVFNSTNSQSVNIPTTGLSTAERALSAVITFKTTASIGTLFTIKSDVNVVANSRFGVSFSGTTLYFNNNGRNGGTTTATINDGLWHQIVIDYAVGGVTNIYVDNVLKATNNTILLSGTQIQNPTINIGVGDLIGSGTKYFTGTVGQFLLYGTVLTLAQRTSIYNSGNFTSSPPTTSLDRSYQFQDGSGNIATDSSPNAISGSLINSPTWEGPGNSPIPQGSYATSAEAVSFMDGSLPAIKGAFTFGGTVSETILRGSRVQTFINNYWPLIQSFNGKILLNPTNTVEGAASTAILEIAGGTATTNNASLKIDPGVLLTTPESGAIENDGSHIYYTNSSAVRKQLDSQELLVFNQGAPVSVGGTTTETSGIGAVGTGSLTLPANYLTGYKLLRLSGRGFYSTTTVAPTLIIKVYIGSVMIATGSLTGLLASASNNSFNFDLDLNTMTTGTSGSVYAQGVINYNGSNLTNFTQTSLDLGSGSATVNTTVANTINITYTWSNNNAANTESMKIFKIESLN